MIRFLWDPENDLHDGISALLRGGRWKSPPSLRTRAWRTGHAIASWEGAIHKLGSHFENQLAVS